MDLNGLFFLIHRIQSVMEKEYMDLLWFKNQALIAVRKLKLLYEKHMTQTQTLRFESYSLKSECKSLNLHLMVLISCWLQWLNKFLNEISPYMNKAPLKKFNITSESLIITSKKWSFFLHRNHILFEYKKRNLFQI